MDTEHWRKVETRESLQSETDAVITRAKNPRSCQRSMGYPSSLSPRIQTMTSSEQNFWRLDKTGRACRPYLADDGVVRKISCRGGRCVGGKQTLDFTASTRECKQPARVACWPYSFWLAAVTPRHFKVSFDFCVCSRHFLGLLK